MSVTERTRLCRDDQLAEAATLELECHGASVIVVRHDGELHAYWNSCPHLSVPLNWGPNRFLDPSKQYLQCATHGALFELHDGRCIAGPCQDDRLVRISLEREGDHYYVAAGQPLPEQPRNLRREALDEIAE
jgi:nitrite reductase/ring-hydroxylating ferredoxin subunit